MLSKEENELLTRTGIETPAGDLLRRYWQPVALAEEVEPGSPPVPVRIFGLDLVLFRSDAGKLGLLDVHCSHRAADLSYGRVEEGGLRCIYHGWLFDPAGRCLDQPGEPEDSTLRLAIRHPSYPCEELGGLILAYFGGGEPPLLPAFEFLATKPEQRVVTKELRECNYLQSNEGNFDPQHLGWLHRTTLPPTGRYVTWKKATVEAEETDFGVRLYTVVPISPEENSIAVHNFVLPNLSAFGGVGNGYGVNWCVPIDDFRHWVYRVQFDRERVADPAAIREGRASADSAFNRTRTAANRYLQDREEMRTMTFAGLGSHFADQDACVTEGEGAIQDRSREHLGHNDVAIAMARRQLLRMIREVQEGREPLNVRRDPAVDRPPEIIARTYVLPQGEDWRAHLREQTPFAGVQAAPV